MYTKCKIPSWLDDYIFKGIGAKNTPNFHKAQYNMEANEAESIQYLGTYFPRSFIESYSIFENLFSIVRYRNIITQMTDISILSFGSGSGGDIIGLLQALSPFKNVKNIHIVALDGNLYHLNLLRQTLGLSNISSRFDIKYEDIPFAILSLKDLEAFCNEIPTGFDFITSFKFVNELFNRSILGNDCFEKLASNLMPKLTDIGLFLLLDVNIPIKGIFMSNLMRDNLSQFMKNNKGYKTLSPIPCHFSEIICTNNKCWPKMSFTAITSKGSNEEGITYRLMGRTELVDYVYPTLRNRRYYVQVERCCPYSQYRGNLYLGYDLNN